MENLDPANLLELVLLSESAIDYQVEFWLTVSFATVVGGFAARELLTKHMRWMICALYLIATVVFASRWYYNFLDINLYMEALDAFGIDSEPPKVTAIGRMLLMSLGSIATVYFVLIGSRARDA